MNASFTGIRNASYCFFNIDKDRGSYERYLNMQLKDDINGEDLTRYRKIIEKFPEFKPAYKYSNFINVKTKNVFDTQVIYMNNVAIPETDEYLPLYSYLGKLTKKVSQLPEEKLPVDRLYLENDYSDKCLLQGKSISEKINKPFAIIKDRLHNPERVLKGAERINNDIYECMVNYIG